MFRVPSLLLTALMALTPVMGALCAGGCDAPKLPSAAQVATSCEHRDVRATAAVLAAAVCSAASADIVVAEIRTADAALTPSRYGAPNAAAPDCLPVPARYLDRQPAQASSPAVLRI